MENCWLGGEGRPDWYCVQGRAAVCAQLSLQIRECTCGWHLIRAIPKGQTWVGAHSSHNSLEEKIQIMDETAWILMVMFWSRMYTAPKYNSVYQVSSQSQIKNNKRKSCFGNQVTVVALLTELFFNCRKYIHFKSSSSGTWQEEEESSIHPLGKLRIFWLFCCKGMRDEQKLHQFFPELLKSLNHIDEGVLERLQFWGNEVIILIIFEHSFFLKLCLSEICQRYLNLDLLRKLIDGTDCRYLNVPHWIPAL